MSFEKIGVTLVMKPAAHGSGIYLRVPKRICEAYDLFSCQVVEFTIDRVKRPEPGNVTLSEKVEHPRTKKRKGEGEE